MKTKKYTVQFKLSNGAVVTWHAVNDLVRLCKSLDERHDGIKNHRWLFCNVYDSKTKEYLGSYQNGEGEGKIKTRASHKWEF